VAPTVRCCCGVLRRIPPTPQQSIHWPPTPPCGSPITSRQAFLGSIIIGMAEPVGALIAYALLLSGGGVASPLLFGITYGMVAGMMVWIAVRELLPTALKYDPEDRISTYGFFGGAAIMAASLLLFRM